MTAKINTVPLDESDSLVEQKTSNATTSGEELRVPSKIWIPVHFLGFLLFGASAFLCYYRLILPKLSFKNQDKASALGSRVLFCALLGLSIWFLIHLVLVYFAITLNRVDEKRGFLQITLIKNGWFISLVLTLLFLSVIMKIFDNRIEMNITKPANIPAAPDPSVETPQAPVTKPPTTMATFFMENLVKLLLASFVFLGILLVKTIIVNGLNFKMLFKNYEARIQRNYEDSQILELLNRITGKKMLPDIEKWAILVFKTISPEKDVIELQTLEYFFGTDDARKVLERFDIDSDNKLTQEEFVLVYQEILNEEKRISMGMTQKVSIVKKLDMILYSILIPVGIFVAISIIGEEATSLVSFMPIQLGTFLSFSFIFGSILADLAKSLVFIFLVEPFDIGDKVLIDGVLHEVNDIGLIYTSLTCNKKIGILQNIKIMEKSIVNLRESKVSKRSFEFTFSSSEEFKEKVESLKMEISKEVNSNPKIYTGKFEICGYNLKRNNAISVNIEVVFRIQNQNIRALRTREDAFVIALQGIFKDVGLILD